MRRRGEREAHESRLASGWTVEADSAPEIDGVVAERAPQDEAVPGDEAVPAGEAIEDPEGSGVRAELSAGALVALGVIGGLYLLYTWVWFSWASHYASVNAAVAESSGAIGSVLQQIVFWAAPFAPALWFFSVLTLNRGGRVRTTVLWLLVGAIVLVPLPMFDFGPAQ